VPGAFAETFWVEKWFNGKLLGRQGTLRASCAGQFYLDEPKRWESRCVLKGESGKLAGLQGTMEWKGLFSEMGTRSYWGKVYWDSK
jgi:hypothetical protein